MKRPDKFVHYPSVCSDDVVLLPFDCEAGQTLYASRRAAKPQYFEHHQPESMGLVPLGYRVAERRHHQRMASGRITLYYNPGTIY